MPVTVERTEWGGWSNCYWITNGEVELILTADIGPRLLRYAYVGGTNAFYECKEELGGAGEAEFRVRGGHRLWTAPEHYERTYAADNFPVEMSVQGAMVDALGPVEGNTGLRKQLIVRMAHVGTSVTVIHRLINTLPWAVEVAPWTITMMAEGGVGFTGFPPRGTHPQQLAPTNPLTMWAFTNFADPRWKFLARYLILRQVPGAATPQKTGLWNERTWGAYWNGGLLYVKRYNAERGRTYPDFGCSFEIWSNATTLELETLGPLGKLEPGGQCEHVERWSLHNVAEPEWTDAGLDAVVGAVL
ncbi:MAG: hypothetical protein IT168_13375 [Bryobacterales bacterium]|nr:hypothetical protein [Bryobacterales bacterium]